MSQFDRRVYEFVKQHPGTTMPEVAAQFPVESKTYGRQRAVSSAIARLRRKGLLRDVAHRCGECGAAQTRGQRNVPLYVAG